MSQPASPNYIKYTQNNQKIPVYFVKFGQILQTDLLSQTTEDNPSISLPQQFSSAPIRYASQTRLNLLTMPGAVTQQITPLAGTSTVSQVQFQLTDRNNVITAMIKAYTMKNRVVTIYGGYQELPENQYIPVFTGIINDIQLQNNMSVYTFYLADINRFLHTGPTGQLFDGATSLYSQLNPGDSYCNVFGTNGFAPRSSMTNSNGQIRTLPPSVINIEGTTQAVSGVPLPVYNFIRIDDEIIGYTGLTAPHQSSNGFQPGTFSGLIRGESLNGIFPGYNSNAAIVTHDAGATVTNFIQIGPANPFDIALMIMTSNRGDGTNGPYDLLGWPPKTGVIPSGFNDQNQGCAVPYKYVDISGFVEQRNQFISQDQMLFFIEQPVSGTDFLSNQIYTFENAYPVVLMNGKLSINIAGPPGPTQNLYTFNDKNTVPNTLQWAANLVSTQGLYNYIEVDYDYDNIIDDNLTLSYNPYAQSINVTGEMAQLKLQSTGLRSSLSGNNIVQRFTYNVFNRYAFGAQKITFNSYYTGHLVNPGDKVLIEMSTLPNLATGTRGGIPLICEIVQKNINFQTGQIQYVALATGYLARKKFGYITPQSIFDGGLFPVYTSGTPAQQQYAFISISGSPVALQSNGAPGTYIAP